MSYSHDDCKAVEEFQKMMAPAVQSENQYPERPARADEPRVKVDLWSDDRIKVGARWKEEIERALASARIAVLFVSPDFLASRFIRENELPPLLKAAENEGVTIFWICLRPCLFEMTPIASYKAAHKIPPALSALRKPLREGVLQTICRKLIDEVANPHPVAPLGNDQTAQSGHE